MDVISLQLELTAAFQSALRMILVANDWIGGRARHDEGKGRNDPARPPASEASAVVES
jgi:hypothetical protein